MTLLELVLALTIVTLIAGGTAFLAQYQGKISARGNIEVELQNHLAYVMKRIESDVRSQGFDTNKGSLIYRDGGKVRMDLPNIYEATPHKIVYLFMQNNDLTRYVYANEGDTRPFLEKISTGKLQKFAVIKDYNKDGLINNSDINFIRSSSLGITPSLGGTLPVHMIFELSEDRRILYASFEAAVYPSFEKTKPVRVAPVTRAIYLNYTG